MRMKLPWLLILVFAVLPFVADKMIRIGVSVYVFAPIFVTLMVAIVIAWIRVWLFPSPKCGKVFRKLTEFPYPSHCRHCGLEKFDDGKETPAIAVHEMAQQQNGSYINTTRLATDAKGVEKS